MISRFVEPVSRSDGIFDFLAIPAKQVSGMGMIKNQSKLNVNVSGIGCFFKRLQHKQCGLKKLCIFGFLEEVWERLVSPRPPLKGKKVLTSCQK
jgi:hypothetical protein